MSDKVTHKYAKKSHSLQKEQELALPEPIGERKSKRGVKRVDYKEMHTGRGQLLSVGDTVVSEHMATLDHDSGDIEIKLLGFERSWRKRVIKEKIAINKLKPNLNGTEGHHISAIFDSLPSALARGARSNSSDHVTSASNHRSHSMESATTN